MVNLFTKIVKRGRTPLLSLAAVLLSSLAFSQVSGTIVDEADGSPIPGATVVVKGTSTGTITDVNGTFSISANPEDVLVFSYVGYTTQEIPVGTTTNFSVNLVLDVQQLEEIVVTGYTAQSKRSITGSVSSIDVDAALEVPAQSIEQSLQGMSPGVHVGAEGIPGGGTMVRIRGFGTLGNNEPLYVIDGTPTRSGLNEINPNDIESIQVLKDASAASIYGARAGNGVVIITTKSGSREGGPQLSFDAFYGTQTIYEGNYPEMLTPQQEADFIFESQTNAGIPFNHPQYGNNPSGAVLPEYISPPGLTGDPGTYDLQSNPIMRANQEGTDWWNEIFDPARIQSYNLAGSGGGQDARYSFSANYYNQEGVAIHTGFSRYTGRFNGEFYVADRVRVGENFTVAYSERVGLTTNQNVNSGPVSDGHNMNQIIPVFDEGENLGFERGFGGPFGGGLSTHDNPIASATRNKDDKDRRLRAFGNAYLEFDFLSDRNLTFKTNIGLDYNTHHLTDYNGVNWESAERISSNSLTEDTDYNTNWAWTNTLFWNETFGSDHNVSVLLGLEAIENQYRQFEGSKVDFFSEEVAFRYLNAGASNPTNAGEGSTWSLWSQFGKVDYGYQDKYLASFTFRRDGSSRFGEGNRFGTFPAVSAGWRLSEEGFMSGASWVDDLKLRIGWGQTGNQEIGDFAFATTFAADIAYSTYDIAGANGSFVAGFDGRATGNTDVQWETTTTLDIGFDLTVLDNRLDFTFDWYDRDTEDMLINPPLPGTAGVQDAPFINIGTMQNTGIDLGINYSSDATKTFTYNIMFNFSQYTNEVTSLGDNDETFFQGESARQFFPTRSKKGEPISSFFGFKTDGIFQSQAEVDAHATQEGAAPGRLRFVDENGDGAISDADRTFIGSPHPDFTWGLNFSMGYDLGESGRLFFNLFGNGVHGQEIMNFMRWFTHFENFQGVRHADQLDRWDATTNPGGQVPRADNSRPTLESNPSEFYIQPGGYFRLRNVQLGYEFPQATLSNIGLSSLRIYLQGKNVLTITDYEGLDPEINLRVFDDPANTNRDIGVDRGAYPIPAMFLLGLNLGL